MNGIQRITAERTRQSMNYDAWWEDQQIKQELVLAALCYAAPPFREMKLQEEECGYYRELEFPWSNWEHTPKIDVTSVSERIEYLAKAGALIAAEIDRLQRLEITH